MKVIKIDFHIHTKAVDNKDGKFTFSQRWLNEYVQHSKLDIISITNHNYFDLEQFNQIDNIMDIEVYPGMELSLENGHVNIILDNNDINKNKLLNFYLYHTKSLNDTEGVKIEDFKSSFDSVKKNLIIVYESGSKSNCISNDYIENLIYNGYTVVPAVSNENKFIQNNSKGISSVLFSDSHASYDDTDVERTNIEELSKKNTYVQVPDNYSFNDIKNNINNSKLIHINKNKLCHEEEINIKYLDESNNVIDNKKINITNGINLIIGKRGSGKTTLLQNLKKYYEEKDKQIEYLEQFSNIDNANKIINEECNRAVDTQYGRISAKYTQQFTNIYNFIKTIDDEDDFLSKEEDIECCLNEAKNHYQVVSKNQYIEQVNWYSDTFDDHSIDTNIKYIQNGIKSLESLKNNHIFWQNFKDIDYSKIRDQLNDFINKSKHILKEEAIKQKMYLEVNNIINNVTSSFSYKTGINHTKPFSDKLSQYIRFKKEKEYINEWLDKFIENYSKKEDSKTFIDEYKIISSFNRYNTITDLKYNNNEKRIATKINDRRPCDLFNKTYKQKDYVSYLYKFKEYINGEEDIIRFLISINADVYNKYNKKASGGQRIGLSLVIKLEQLKSKYYDVILIDEPENSLDNMYIDKELSNKIKELSETSTIFISTHSSILGKILKDSQLIYTECIDDQYNIYSGNYLDKKIYNNDNMQNMYESFINLMEAGESGYKGKVDIYEYLRTKE